MTYKDKGSYESSPPCILSFRFFVQKEPQIISEGNNFSESLAPNWFELMD